MKLLKIEEGTSIPQREESMTQEERSVPLGIGRDTMSAMLVVARAGAQSLLDSLALQAKALYDDWEDVIGQTVSAGFKFRYGGKLYKTIQPTLLIQEQYVPGAAGTESLYTEINEQNQGTMEDPITYNNNMELENGKYYIQNGVTYRCIRDTGKPVYNNLSALVGIYVEIV